MRTGAIFARGSCRALKWMALVGMVFALGAVEAAAQLSNGTLTIDAPDPREGGSTTISVTVSAEVTANTATATTVTVTVSAAALSNADGGENTPAEDGDYTLGTDSTDPANEEVTVVFDANVTADSVRMEDTATVLLQTSNTDADAESEDLRLTVTYSGGGLANPAAPANQADVTIVDKDPQTYVLALMPATQTPEEGDVVTVQVSAVPPHVEGSERLTINIDRSAPDYTFGITSTDTNAGDAITDNQVTIGNANTAAQVATATITLTTPPNDMNRVLDTVMMTAHSGQPGAGVPEATLSIGLADNNALPAITAALTDANGMAVTDGMLTEGNTYMLTLSAPAAVGEDITVSVTQTGGSAMSTDDYSLGQSLIMIPTGETSSAAVTLEVDLNDDIVDDTLVLSAEVGGEAANGTETDTIAMLLSLTLVDATTKLVTVATDAMTTIYGAIDTAEGDDEKLNPGETITLMKSALFDAVTGWDVRVDADTDDSGVASVEDEGAEIKIEPSAPGTATITITGTAVQGASSFEGANLSRDVAEIKFMVTVELAPPGMPRNLTATPGDGQVWLKWDHPNTGGDHSGYEYRVDAGEWKSKTSTTVGFWVSDLTNGVAYVFELRAVNDAGKSEAVSVKETPVATPVDESQVVTVKSVSAATSVAESGGLEVTVTATVPAGTKGADDKIAPIASKHLYVSFPIDDASIAAGEAAEVGDDLTVLGDLVWEKIARTEKASEASFKFRVAIGQDLDAEDEKFQVMVSIDGDGKKSKVVTVDDAEEQTYELSLPAAAKGAIAEGKSATLTLEAKPKRTIDIPVTLALEPNDPSKYTLSVANGTFGTTSFETTVSAKADSDRADDTITVTAYTDRDGEFASLDITITDANALPAVEATLVDKDGKALDPQPESVMEGETVMVMLTAVDKDGKAMKAAEKLTITLMPTGTADSSDYRLSSQSIEIASGKESSAAVDLMITEDQDIGDETLMFDAAVGGEAKNGTEKGLEALSIELRGPEDMNLAEGMSAMVTATANRAATADTMVMLMRDRAMSTAGDDDYMAEAITIMAGEMTGSTMVMAVEDNMAEDMEELVLYGMTEGMAGEVTGEVHLYLWDAAVPALPVIAQLLLAAFLAVGGYRRYRRR